MILRLKLWWTRWTRLAEQLDHLTYRVAVLERDATSGDT